MGHENVRQLQTLSTILGEQLSLVSAIGRPTVAVLGITGGNGLGNFEPGRCKRILGMDINADYLRVCRERYGHLPELELYQIDLMTEKDRAIEILKDADLITANLVVQHIHLENFIDIIGKLTTTKPTDTIISVTIQFDPDGIPFSSSGYEASFGEIRAGVRLLDEASLTASMRGAGYAPIGRESYIMPNEKLLIRLDYKR